MATVEKMTLRGERTIVLSGISWDLYEQLRASEENRRVRMTVRWGVCASTRRSACRRYGVGAEKG